MQGTKAKAPRDHRILKRKKSNSDTLPIIPNKCYFTIGEVAFLCALKPHVLRFWENEFSQLKPLKRRGNRRCYQYNDILVIRQIKKLLYDDGFTIDGARAQLKVNLLAMKKSEKDDAEIKKLIADLEGILQELTA